VVRHIFQYFLSLFAAWETYQKFKKLNMVITKWESIYSLVLRACYVTYKRFDLHALKLFFWTIINIWKFPFQPFLMLMLVHKTILASLLKSGTITSEDFPEMQVFDVVPNDNVPSNLPQFVLKLKGIIFNLYNVLQ
jgi:hypothetical protein